MFIFSNSVNLKIDTVLKYKGSHKTAYDPGATCKTVCGLNLYPLSSVFDVDVSRQLTFLKNIGWSSNKCSKRDSIYFCCSFLLHSGGWGAVTGAEDWWRVPSSGCTGTEYSFSATGQPISLSSLSRRRSHFVVSVFTRDRPNRLGMKRSRRYKNLPQDICYIWEKSLN